MRKILVCIWTFFMMLAFVPAPILASAELGVSYQAHVQNIGWQSAAVDGATAGTTGQSLRLEALKLQFANAPGEAGIKYQAHVQNIGWQSIVSNGQEAGTTGQSLRLEALKITLENLPGYSLEYRGHVQNIGWMPWVTDGEIVGTTGQSLRLEAIEIRLVNAATLRIGDYFPIRENIHSVYEGQGNEFASYDVFIDYTTPTKVQQRINNGGTVTVDVIEEVDHELVKTMSQPETYYRENMLGKVNREEILLMEPIKVGTTWTLADGRTRSITNLAAGVTTPYGNYQAIEVTTTTADHPTEQWLDYYVKDLGLVKSVFKNTGNGTEITSSLKTIEEGAVMTKSISFFYPNINDDKIYYQIKEIGFHTNDITRDTLANAYKADAPFVVFSPNTKINSLYLNQDGMVYLDLSGDYLTEMNAGAELEAMMLQSIANTFGKYYGVDRVLLTIDNKLYQSGHVSLAPGEYLTVDLNGTVLLN
nr:GerMN domain-containing protein [uncultured Acetobacterium sp.]